jgi:hypothetical protein
LQRNNSTCNSRTYMYNMKYDNSKIGLFQLLLCTYVCMCIGSAEGAFSVYRLC